MKMYQGIRTNAVPTVYVDTAILSLDKANELHPSMSTVEWGYRGQGPTQLALAILLDCLDQTLALQYYPQFRDDFVSTFSYDGFVLLESQIKTWLENQLKNIQ